MVVRVIISYTIIFPFNIIYKHNLEKTSGKCEFSDT